MRYGTCHRAPPPIRYAGRLSRPGFHNHVFDSLNAPENQLEVALHTFENNAPMVKFIVTWGWIVIALLH